MSPEPTGSRLASFDLPVDYWYESPIGWALVALMLAVAVVALVIVVRILRSNRTRFG